MKLYVYCCISPWIWLQKSSMHSSWVNVIKHNIRYIHSFKNSMINGYIPYYNPEDSELLYISQKQLKRSWISILPKPCDVMDTKNEEKVWCVHPTSNSILAATKNDVIKSFHLYARKIFNLLKSNAWLLSFFVYIFDCSPWTFFVPLNCLKERY